MPFQKGKATPGAGRKGFEIEQAQLKKMRNILNNDLLIAKKFQKSKKLNPLEEKKLQVLQARMLKYADKLHASKTDITSDGKQINISVSPEIAEQNGIK